MTDRVLRWLVTVVSLIAASTAVLAMYPQFKTGDTDPIQVFFEILLPLTFALTARWTYSK